MVWCTRKEGEIMGQFSIKMYVAFWASIVISCLSKDMVVKLVWLFYAIIVWVLSHIYRDD